MSLSLTCHHKRGGAVLIRSGLRPIARVCNRPPVNFPSFCIIRSAIKVWNTSLKQLQAGRSHAFLECGFSCEQAMPRRRSLVQVTSRKRGRLQSNNQGRNDQCWEDVRGPEREEAMFVRGHGGSRFAALFLCSCCVNLQHTDQDASH